MTTFLNYIKDINLSEVTPNSIDHSNEFSIESEDNNTIAKSKVKFVNLSDSNQKLNDYNNKKSKLQSNKIYEYFDNIKINLFNYYFSSNPVSIFITILYMVIKIIYKNLVNK